MGRKQDGGRCYSCGTASRLAYCGRCLPTAPRSAAGMRRHNGKPTCWADRSDGVYATTSRDGIRSVHASDSLNFDSDDD